MSSDKRSGSLTNDDRKETVLDSFNGKPLYPNRNYNNFSGGIENDSSDWEDFIVDDNDIISELKITAPPNNNNETHNNVFSLSTQLGCSRNNEDNFELIHSDDDEDEVKFRDKKYNCESSFELISGSEHGKSIPKCSGRHFLEYIWMCFNQLWDIMIYIYAKLTCQLYFLHHYNMICFLKAFSNFAIVSILFPFTTIYKKIKWGLRKLKDFHLHRYKPMSSNNNAVDCIKQKTIPFFWVYAFCLVVVIGGLSINCWYNPESKICLINNVVNRSKLKIISIFHELYILPGNDCMQMGKCCKGFMEASFRWINCFLTLPIRSILTSRNRQSLEKEVISSNIDDMKVKVETFINDLAEAKDRTIKHEEILLKIRQQFNVLEKSVEEKSKDVSSLEPILKSMRKMMEKMNLNITQGMNEIKNIISIEQDSEKIIETMKMIAGDSFHSVRISISKMHSQIEAEHKRLNLRVGILESIVNEGRIKLIGNLSQFISKIKNDLEQLKLNQKDLQKRFSKIKEIPNEYRESSEGLKSEINKKLMEELKFHDENTKKSESVCLAKLNKFKEELPHLNTHFTCFVESLISDQAKIIENKLHDEVNDNLYENLAEIAKSQTKEFLNKQSKSQTLNHLHVKSVNERKDFNKIEKITQDCNLESTGKMTNYSAFCLNNQHLKEDNNEDGQCLSNKQIEHLVNVAVAQYSNDKIGLADFALESMGGSVLASKSSPTYNSNRGLLSFFTIPIFRSSKSLRAIIQPGNQPGDCWPFPGSTGYAVIQLSHKIYVSAITLEHLPVSLHPEGKITSAPKQFQIFSLSEHSYERQDLIGTFEYAADGQSIQTFLVEVKYQARIIQMVILSNHGNEEYTCVYRLRVHGTIS